MSDLTARQIVAAKDAAEHIIGVTGALPGTDSEGVVEELVEAFGFPEPDGWRDSQQQALKELQQYKDEFRRNPLGLG